MLPLNVTVCGDVTVIVYHARNTMGGVVQGRPTGLKMCQFQFHTGFIGVTETTMRLARNQLDETSSDADVYGPHFCASLSFMVLDQERVVQPEPWGMMSSCLFLRDSRVIFYLSDALCFVRCWRFDSEECGRPVQLASRDRRGF